MMGTAENACERAREGRWELARGDGVRVTATPAALALIERLKEVHGALVFFQSGGCCAGSSPMCLPLGDLPFGPGDLRLGEIGGCSFYIDADQYERWRRPQFVIDVVPGIEDSFSLETPGGVHFTTRTADGAPACDTCTSRP